MTLQSALRFTRIVAILIAIAFVVAAHARAEEQSKSNLLYDSGEFGTGSAQNVPEVDDAVNEETREPARVLFVFEEEDASEALETENPAEETPAESETNVAESAPALDVLIDLRHAHDFSNFPLTIDDHYYHRIYSFNKAFGYLKSQGVVVREYDSNAPITRETLSRVKTLFLNLPSGDKAPFLVGEIAAIKSFVREGGSIFFIVDHTNCYFHQSRLEPLFRELEIEPQFYGVCDSERRLGEGSGWLYFNDFVDHPVTRGLHEIAFQTGGGVDPKDAVVRSSATSWQDAPGMPIYGEADLAYYGNFTPDPEEPRGPSGVVLAKEFGKGRVVVVGDQNLFSAFFLQYLDVYRLWINSFAWLLDRPELADPARYMEEARRGRVVLCWEDLSPGAKRFGDPDARGYYHIYAILCRYYNPFCVARDDSGVEGRTTLFLNVDETTSNEAFEAAYVRLKRGETIIALDPPDDVWRRDQSAAKRLLDKLQKDGIGNNRVVDETEKNPFAMSEKKFVERVEFSNGAAFILTRGKYSFDNSTVPKPESKVFTVDQENIQILLTEIDAVFASESGADSASAPATQDDGESPKVDARRTL